VKLFTTDLGLYSYCPIFYRESKKSNHLNEIDIEFYSLRECLLRAFKNEASPNKKMTCKSFCSEWDQTYWKAAIAAGYDHKQASQTSIKAWIWLTQFYRDIYSEDTSRPLFVKFSRDHNFSPSIFLSALHEVILYSSSLDSLVLCSTASRASPLQPLKDDIVQRANAYLLSKEVTLPIILRRYVLNLKGKPSKQEVKTTPEFHLKTQGLLSSIIKNIESNSYLPHYSQDCKTCPFNDSRCSI
jgi:hypothetical protein